MRPKYKVFYFTIGADTKKPKLFFQQLPHVLRDTGLSTLAVHVAPAMHASLHVTDSMAGDVSFKNNNKHKAFVSKDKKLRVHYLSMFVEKKHVRLLSNIVRWRNKNQLLTVIGDFSTTLPYTPFNEDLTSSLKHLLNLRYVYTIPNAVSDKGAAKTVYEPTARNNPPIARNNPAYYVSIPQKKYRYRFHTNMKPRLSHHRAFINITGKKSRNGYVSISRNSSPPISLSP
jgi:hypothetical protein